MREKIPETKALLHSGQKLVSGNELAAYELVLYNKLVLTARKSYILLFINSSELPAVALSRQDSCFP